MGSRVDPFQSLQLNRTHLHEQIADKIQAMIGSRQLQRGTQLPSERELARQLGVGRSTVREAMRLLEQSGLVEMKAGSGAFVTDVPATVIGDSIAHYSVFGISFQADFLELREILEPEAAALAAERATAEDLARLEHLVEEIEDAFLRRDPDAYASADTSFHNAMAAATHNELISSVARGLQKVMKTWIRTEIDRYWPEEGARSHRPVYDAISARNPEFAREKMRIHMFNARKTLLGHTEEF